MTPAHDEPLEEQAARAQTNSGYARNGTLLPQVYRAAAPQFASKNSHSMVFFSRMRPTGSAGGCARPIPVAGPVNGTGASWGVYLKLWHVSDPKSTAIAHGRSSSPVALILLRADSRADRVFASREERAAKRVQRPHA